MFSNVDKKCSTNSWDKQSRKAVGCDYIEWINGTSEPLDEDCPTCGEKLVLYTTAKGKKMKKRVSPTRAKWRMNLADKFVSC